MNACPPLPIGYYRTPRHGRGRVADGFYITCAARALLAMLFIVCVTGNVSAIFAQGETLTEYHVKAAFLYNIAKFVQWPAGELGDSATPFNLCVVGVEPFISMRETLTGKQIQGHEVVVRRAEHFDTAENCQMLFVSAIENATAGALLTDATHPVLTVGETPDFINKGGIINLKTVNNKIRFEIDRDAGQRHGFRFSAQLLKLAILVDRPR